MELTAPSHWRCVDFISDIHLDKAQPKTFDLWSAYLANTTADAVFILGDLFELWVGDDVLNESSSFEHSAVAVLRSASERLSLHVMVGNRDFLMGTTLMAACGAVALADPSVLTFHSKRFVLSHGDALCTADTDYQAFRQMVRSPNWQADFLAKPLPQRQEIARSIRLQSESKKQSVSEYADVDTQAALELLNLHKSQTLIHGHTHKPATIALPGGSQRIVLSDWVANMSPPRADVIRLTCNANSGPRVDRLSPAAIAKVED